MNVGFKSQKSQGEVVSKEGLARFRSVKTLILVENTTLEEKESGETVFLEALKLLKPSKLVNGFEISFTTRFYQIERSGGIL